MKNQSSPSPRAEFYRVCNEIKKSGLAKIVVFKKRGFSNKNIGAYVTVNVDLPIVYLERKTGQSYTQLLMYLLHEVGHIIDYKRHSRSKRWKIASHYEYGSNAEQVKNYSNKVKFELLRTESIAEGYVEKLLKRYKVTLPVSYQEIEIQYNHAMFAVLFEFTYGRYVTEKERPVIRNISEKYNRLTLQDFRNFIKDKGLFFEFCFGRSLGLVEK